MSTLNGQDPEMQLRELREYCQRRGLTLIDEYVDTGISGARDRRPELDRLLTDAHRRRFDSVVVWSAKIDPVPYSKLDNPQSLNLYSYVLNNPLSNVDADGHACSGVLGNTGSGFFMRATEYGQIDARPEVHSQTRFFAAANAVSQALADVAVPVSSRFGVSPQTASFLEGVGQKLEKLNQTEASAIKNGTLSGPNLDQRLVHNEQSEVQSQLDKLQKSDPAAYKSTISEINGALNPGATGQFASTVFSTDKAYSSVLDGVRKDLGRDIDFSKQSDREAIGNALINHIRQTGGCDVNGKKQTGC